MLILVGALGACGSASTSKGAWPGSADAGANRPGSGGAGGDAGAMGPGGSGGSSASGGSAGSSAGSGMGGGASGGSAGSSTRDASAARDAGLDAGADAGARDLGPPPCFVTLSPVAPGRLLGAPAGANTRLRMRAEVGGTAPRMPAWTQTVRHESAGPVPTTRIALEPTDPATVLLFELVLERPGRYAIQAGVSPTCQATEIATAIEPAQRQATYFLRVIPPVASGLPPQEVKGLQVQAGRGGVRDLQLQRGTPVTIDPRDNRNVSLPSYVRISSPRSSLLFEGHTRARAFELPLDPQIHYDVLVVPDVPAPPATPFPPALWTTRRPLELGALTFTLGTGARVRGEIRDGLGAPVEGARVLLRAGALTSTIATTAMNGSFELRVAPGTYDALVLPPRSSTLPEAQVEPGSVVQIAPSDTMVALGLRYAALPEASLDLTVSGAGGRAMRIRLESRPGALPDVGTLTVDGDAIRAVGRVLVERVTGGDGRASFPRLPRAKYRVTVLPEEPDPALGVTTTELDLTSASPMVTRTLPLGSRLTVGGRLDPAMVSAGRQVLAVDLGADVAAVTATSTVAADGRFVLELDPERSYRLFLEPTADRQQPRIPLGPLVTGTSGRTLPTVTVPGSVTVTGTVTGDRSAMPGAPLLREAIAGVLIQAYCVGLGPDCVDEAAPSVETARPVGEGVSDDRGAFQLNVADPAFTSF